MFGINAISGRSLGGISHLRQSIADILGTPIGSRVMRREYGSRLFSLIDAPANAATRLDIIAATAEALITWEPRLEVESVSINQIGAGQLVLDLVGIYLPDGLSINVDGVVVS